MFDREKDQHSNQLTELKSRMRTWVPSKGHLDWARVTAVVRSDAQHGVISKLWRTLRAKSFVLTAVASTVLPAAYCLAQGNPCYSTGIRESIPVTNLAYDRTSNMYDFGYQVTVDWSCMNGVYSLCTVCELDTLYVLVNGQYTWYASVQTSDSAQCNSQNNEAIWWGTFYGLAPSRNWKLIAAYKPRTLYSGCDSPSGFQIGAVSTFNTY